MKILLIPDSFKGTMSSTRICEIMKNAVTEIFPTADVVSIPVADGGEGSVDAFLQAVGGIKKNVEVNNPFFEKMQSFYGILSDNKTLEKTAVIEMACASGLPLAEGRLNPAITTTYGVGELIADALDDGCKNIIVGLGGSATNDGGCGMACALGVQFFNSEGKAFIPLGGTLAEIRHIDTSKLNPAVHTANIITICDIDNPLYGENGAAYIFAPQKGADKQMVKMLDNGLRHLAKIIKQDLQIDQADARGSGAAGGMGYGMMSFLGSKLQAGIETVLDTVDFDSKLQNADYVFTGEGKFDAQSLRGKVVIGVAQRAKKAQVPVIAVVGDAENNLDEAYQKGIASIFTINRKAVPFEIAKKTAEQDLHTTMKDILRLIKSVRR